MKQLTLGLLVSTMGCLEGSLGPQPPLGKEIALQNGVVSYFDLEGGFYAIRGQDGQTYDPVNLPESFQIDGLAIAFQGYERPDLVSIHMAGILIELTHIQKRWGTK